MPPLWGASLGRGDSVRSVLLLWRSNIRIELEFSAQNEEALQKLLSEFVGGIAADVEAEAKILAPVDTGQMRAGIHYSMIEPLKFVVSSGVFYDVFWETGTKRHFVPFFDRSGAITPLGRWAMRNIGWSEEELGKRGGFMIQTEARHMYAGGIEKALENIRSKYGGA